MRYCQEYRCPPCPVSSLRPEDRPRAVEIINCVLATHCIPDLRVWNSNGRLPGIVGSLATQNLEAVDPPSTEVMDVSIRATGLIARGVHDAAVNIG